MIQEILQRVKRLFRAEPVEVDVSEPDIQPDIMDICRRLENSMSKDQRLNVISRLRALGWVELPPPAWVYAQVAKQEIARFGEPESTPYSVH